MILFFCPQCKEELEAEDSIKGTRMQCPACEKEIEVPRTSAHGPPKGTRRDHAPSYADEGHSGGRFILIVLVAGVLGLLVLGGVGWTLVKRERERAERARPKCPICEGSGKAPCTACKGSKSSSCRECSGSGKRKNFRDQEEDCYVCSARGVLTCLVCDGRGSYGCSGCGGAGRLPADGPR